MKFKLEDFLKARGVEYTGPRMTNSEYNTRRSIEQSQQRDKMRKILRVVK